MSDTGFWHARRVLVGGGCGFIGSYLVPELVDFGAIVTVIDNLETGEVSTLASVRSDIHFIEGDLRDRGQAESATRGQDVVMNLAASVSGIGYSSAHHGEMLTQNLLSTLVPLDAARVNNVARYLVVSSSCVYPWETETPLTETSAITGEPEPDNAGYAWAKRIAELAGLYYGRDYDMQVSIVRPFNVYGGRYRWRSRSRAHVIPALVQRIVDGEDPLVVWGSGRQRRNFIHARELAKLMCLVVERDIHGEPINLGFETETSVAELVELICEIVNHRPQIVYDASKPEGLLSRVADATRLRVMTEGYEPTVSLRDGLVEMVEAYRHQRALAVESATR
ncbi:MAG: NAD-dependent epimerase/dehydratase family protein [Acidobacteriota bacterium]|nr:NAD-dependent epimerase/dehydratase family protein [Acidobacteriota bacterium]